MKILTRSSWVAIMSVFGHCSQIDAFDNVALGKPTMSFDDWPAYPAERAVDGEPSPGYDHCAVVRAPIGQVARWYVDLEASYWIQKITIYNTDGHTPVPDDAERFTNFILSVGPTLTELTDCGDPFTGSVPEDGHLNVSCDRVGRYVHLRKFGDRFSRYMVLCEVNIYGTRQYKNVALGKPAFASGIVGPYEAERAVDGILYPSQTNCAIIKGLDESAARWWVDLQAPYRIRRIRIFNTDGRFGNAGRFIHFVLSVGQTLSELADCGPPFTGILSNKSHTDISCNQVGQIVHLRRVAGPDIHYITLCEVRVFGTLEYDCRLCPTDVPCHSDTGCSQCSPGKVAPACTDECFDGTYGVDCTNSCGHCASNAVCDKVAGDCPAACQLWWAGDKCITRIVSPRVYNETLRITHISNSSATMAFDPLRSVPGELAEFYAYMVRYKEHGGLYQQGPTSTHGASTKSVFIAGLKHNTLYDITMDTYRVQGDTRDIGAAYPVVSFTTKCNSPAQPHILSFEIKSRSNGTTGSIVITYQDVTAVDSGCDRIVAVLVEHKHEGDIHFRTQITNPADTVFSVLTTESGWHTVRIVAINDEGLSAASLPQIVAVPGTGADIQTTSSVNQSEKSTTGGVSDAVIIAVVCSGCSALITVTVTLIVLCHRRRSSKQGQGTEMAATTHTDTAQGSDLVVAGCPADGQYETLVLEDVKQ